MKAVIALYFLTLALKVLGYLYTGYFAILADAYHSVADISMLLALYFARRFSTKGGDETHPFGHAMLRNVASLIVAVCFITVLAFEILEDAAARLLNPSAGSKVAEAIVFEVAVLAILLVAASLSRGAGILNRTVFYETVNDALSTVAAIVGIALSSLNPVFDVLAAIVIAAIIVYNASKLIYENIRFLIGMSPSQEFYDMVESVVSNFEEVKGVHDMLGVYVGENEVHLDIHVTVSGDMKIVHADELSERISKKLREEFPEIKHVTIHFCPHEGAKRKICP